MGGFHRYPFGGQEQDALDGSNVEDRRSSRPGAVHQAGSGRRCQSVVPKLGCAAETLRKWVRQAQRDAGHRPGRTTRERERWTALEREVRELKRANEILRKPSVYFAHAD